MGKISLLAFLPIIFDVGSDNAHFLYRLCPRIFVNGVVLR